MSLSALSAYDWTYIVGGSWLILACVVAVPLGRAMRDPEVAPDDTLPATYPPPVPPVDAAWLASQPVDCLSDAAVHDLFDDLIKLQGLR